MGLFVDRENELAALERLHQSQTGTLLILYGRRRVGKTALIQKFLENKQSLYFLATEENETENLGYFRSLVSTYLSNDLIRDAGGLGWEKLAGYFIAAAGKKVLVIDEFQYLCHANSAFSSIMQRLYDTIFKPAGVMVILCGSYISMMESETLNYDSPLYGRRDGQIKLSQIPFRHYHDFFPGKQEDELIQYYSVTGGVPRYVEMLANTTDLLNAIETGILDSQSMLFEEPYFLLTHEVRDIGNYFTVLKTIAAGHRRQSAIAAAMQVPQTSLSKLLVTLIHLDLLERRVPVTETNPEKSKKSHYLIKDNFLAFWFRFVFPYRSTLSLRDMNEAKANLAKNLIVSHVSYVFENICAEKLWDMSISNAFSCSLNKVGNWWNNRSEIDLVGLGNDQRTLILAECKYQGQVVGPGVLQELKNKAQEIEWNNKNRQEQYVLFSRTGFDRNLSAMAAEDSTIHLVSIKPHVIPT